MWRALGLLGVSRIWTAKTILRAYAVALLLLSPAGILYWVFDAQLLSLATLGIACAVYAVVVYIRYQDVLKPLLARLGLGRTLAN